MWIKPVQKRANQNHYIPIFLREDCMQQNCTPVEEQNVPVLRAKTLIINTNLRNLFSGSAQF